MKKSAILLITFNIFWGIVQIYRSLEYLYSRNLLQDVTYLKSFVGFTIFCTIIVYPFNIIQLFTPEKRSIWSYYPYVISLIFVGLTTIFSFGLLFFV